MQQQQQGWAQLKECVPVLCGVILRGQSLDPATGSAKISYVVNIISICFDRGSSLFEKHKALK